MVRYLECKTIKDSIEAARSAKDTINYWKAVLSLYFPATEGFSLIHLCTKEDMLVLRFPIIPQKPEIPQHDSQCIIVVSAEDKDWPHCEDQESDAYTYVRDLDPESHGREAFGINASGPCFSLFKVTGNRHYSLIRLIPISNVEEMIVGHALEYKFDQTHIEAYENQCKLIMQSADDMHITAHLDDSDAAFTLKRLSNALPITTITRYTPMQYSFFKTEYEKLVPECGTSFAGSFNVWWTILSCIENSRIRRNYIGRAGIPSLNYLSTPSEAQPPEIALSSRCLLMVKLYEQPQWKVSDSNVYTLLRKVVAERVDGYIHGVLACGPQFLLFQVYRNGVIHCLMGTEEIPLNLGDLLNNAELRERFDEYMNGIVPKDI